MADVLTLSGGLYGDMLDFFLPTDAQRGLSVNASRYDLWVKLKARGLNLARCTILRGPRESRIGIWNLYNPKRQFCPLSGEIKLRCI